MKSIRRVVSRISALFRRHGSADAELRAELEAHLALATDENIRGGMEPGEARRHALAASGGIVQAAEEVRAQRSLPWVEDVAADLRFALRHFRRTPLSTVTMVLVLSLGIGTTVVLFTVLNSLATMPSPGITRDETLVRIRGTMQLEGVSGVQARDLSWPEVQRYAARAELFEDVAAWSNEMAAVRTGDDAESTITSSVIYATSNYFSVLGVAPVLGTVPRADETGALRMTTSPTALISHAMWQQYFGGATDVIGRTLRVNDVPLEIVGVAPPRFIGTGGTGAITLWVPLAALPQLQKRTGAVFLEQDSMLLSAAARLRADVTTRGATPVIAGIAAREFRPGREGSGTRLASGDFTSARAVSGSADVVPMLAGNAQVRARTDLIVSGVAAGGFAVLVLLITCTNVSALLVGHAVARRREIGVRLSLGAPRRRLIRQLLTESVLLSLMAAGVGLLITMAGIGVFAAEFEDVQLVVDWRVTLASAAAAIITGILFGISPALHATRVSVGDVLKSTSLAVAASRSRLQRALVVAQIALTQPLLVGLGVLTVTMVSDANTRATSGVPAQIAEVELDTWAGNASNDERATVLAVAVERVAAIPGVIAAMPMQLGTMTGFFAVHPDDRLPGIEYDESMTTSMMSAPDGYFDAFGIPLVQGRDFDAAERARPSNDALSPFAIETVIIGSDLARRLWGDANPIGRRFILASRGPSTRPPLVVVGVVDALAAGPSALGDGIRVYVPYSTVNTGVLARTAGPAQPMISAIRQAVSSAAPQMPVFRAETMEQREAQLRREVLQASSAVAAGGMLALFLSAIGLYAVVSFGVNQRRREIGIRSALGARSAQVVRMFFLRGFMLSAIGLVLGLPLSIIATRMIATSLGWPLSSSPLVGVAIAMIVLAVASIAAWIPARHASRIDPLIALRTE